MSAPDITQAVSPLVSKRLWWLALIVGCAVWLCAAVVTAATDDVILVPTVLLLGSFLMPVTLVMFALSPASEGYLTAEVVLLGFLGGGTIVPAAGRSHHPVEMIPRRFCALGTPAMKAVGVTHAVSEARPGMRARRCR